ncbi:MULTISPECIES: SprT-like domain-containing protein [unclassified Kaistella]|uniref:SprT-like domain-containing protein n=1 Tax=unclassified Kaistella TaxID=2762626 RepID=UPI002733310C|nr:MULTISPECIES: SprT-like domain-containing protein [unclassified Kaistella]MDP2452963.1 transcription elongation protein SprT [Kaistella sp. SH11-4b]MDP2455872.1 transcription elongation protein SprT [Kaistella sp. SH40-3]MDP2458776.1 transcription elongation protein SprT [Kaistella sp. SH19-2b]
MSISLLEKYLPENCLPYLKKWFSDYSIHIKITRGRNSKLGDYRKMPDKSHQITINSTLQPPLFFFVLTHELAHLLAFENFGHRISAHGSEWKNIFSTMLLESISIYDDDLKPIILKFLKSPKANFMSSPELVRYFHIEDYEDESSYIEDLEINDRFIYRKQTYIIDEKRKKNYLCTQLDTDKKYIFKPLARVEKIS